VVLPIVLVVIINLIVWFLFKVIKKSAKVEIKKDRMSTTKKLSNTIV